MNTLDRLINFFNPQAGLKRAQSRAAQEVLRNYDIASPSRRNDGWFRPNSSGGEEVSKASQIGAATAQELVRNNPLAGRIKRVWANNAIGDGIECDVKATSTNKALKFQKSWDSWANSTECDLEGHYNFYGLQWLWLSTVVESGGVFIRKIIDPNMKGIPLKLQTLEQSQLDRAKNLDNVVDGIEYNNDGSIKGYWFILDRTKISPESRFFKKSEVEHIFRKERVGQHLGMTWLANVATILRNYDTYMDAKLMQQQIAACFALIVEDADNKIGLGSKESNNQLPDSIEPAMVEYVKAGSVPHVVTPPKADNSSQFDGSIKADIAGGAGITYEQLTGDYSKVNFASGRMGRSEFYNELDFVQKSMLKPSLNTVFEWFSSLYKVINGNADYSPDWAFPTRSSVNPKEEFEVLMSKVRHGMLSPSKAAKILGEKLDIVIAQWENDKELFGEMPFDIDPSKFAATGNQLDNNDAASSNQQANVPK